MVQPQTDNTGEGGPCPAGSFCEEGSNSPVPCPAGKLTKTTGQVIFSLDEIRRNCGKCRDMFVCFNVCMFVYLYYCMCFFVCFVCMFVKSLNTSIKIAL